MSKVLSAQVLVWAVLAGCTPPCEEAFSATLGIEETGATELAASVSSFGSIGGDRSGLFLSSANYELTVDFEAPPDLGQELTFGPREGALPVARIGLVQDFVVLCDTEGEPAEGSLVIRRIAWNDDAFVTCIDASLRVRFSECEAVLGGRTVSTLTFTAELPSE